MPKQCLAQGAIQGGMNLTVREDTLLHGWVSGWVRERASDRASEQANECMNG